MLSRIATPADLDAVTGTIALAFEQDPVWGVALARPDGSREHLHAFWRHYVVGAGAHSTVYLLESAASVAVWLPPGAEEIAEDEAAALDELVESALTPDSARAMHELWSRFEAARPQDEPHAYLSLLATHPSHRGRGIGQALLRDGLDRWDSEGLPSYLESTNPANNHRYERAGFTPVGGFRAVLDDAPVTTMWRAAR